MNPFWTRIGVYANDVVFTQEAHSLCELGDPSEFVAYGEARCQQIGIEDDEEAVLFLSQAFQGGVRLWYDSLGKDVQSSWFLLKQALLEEFGDGQVLESMQLLSQVWWKVSNYEDCFHALWKVYEQVSLFHETFLHVLKRKMLEEYRLASLELQELHSNEVLDDDLQENAIQVDSNVKDILFSHQSDLR